MEKHNEPQALASYFHHQAVLSIQAMADSFQKTG
jgi:hypothetical protein